MYGLIIGFGLKVTVAIKAKYYKRASISIKKVKVIKY